MIHLLDRIVRGRIARMGMALVSPSLLLGCGDDMEPPATCHAENMVGAICAGVPAAEVCPAETCTQGVACASVVHASSDAELSAAAVSASAGTCIVLAPGQYAGVILPGGVSLLGRAAWAVRIDSVTLAAGDGAVLRGLGVGSGGIHVQGATGVRIQSVRVTGARELERDGIALDPGSAVTILESEIGGSGRAGVFASDADVTLDRSVIWGAQGGGIRIQGSGCDASCACASQPALVVKNSVIRDNHIIGIATLGARAIMEAVDVKNSLQGDALYKGSYGGGISTSGCSEVLSAKNMRVLGHVDWGFLVDHSRGALGGEGEGETIEISDNKRGLWIQNVTQPGCTLDTPCIVLEGGTLERNRGVGLGVAGQSRGIIFCRSRVADTAMIQMSVFGETDGIGWQDVGDGVDWLDQSEVSLEQLTLSGNARRSLLIDGATGGDGGYVGVILEGGDEGRPPLQQNYPTGGMTPGGAAVEIQAARMYAIPRAPAAL